MVEENSGVLYCFKLDHNLGYGYAEYYDFTDVRVFDGRFLFIYNLIDSELPKEFDIDKITSSGIALGPIALFKEINIKGKVLGKRLERRILSFSKVGLLQRICGAIPI